MSNNFAGLLLNSFSDIIFELQEYYITIALRMMERAGYVVYRHGFH